MTAVEIPSRFFFVFSASSLHRADPGPAVVVPYPVPVNVSSVYLSSGGRFVPFRLKTHPGSAEEEIGFGRRKFIFS